MSYIFEQSKRLHLQTNCKLKYKKPGKYSIGVSNKSQVQGGPLDERLIAQMTRNRTRGLGRGQDVQGSNRNSEPPSSNSASANSSNFDEEKFWSSLEKNYFSPPPAQLIKSFKSLKQMYKIVDAGNDNKKCAGKSTSCKPCSINFKVFRCKRYRDDLEWKVVCARDRYNENASSPRRLYSVFDPTISPKYHGRGVLPLVMRPSPNILSVTLMDSPFSLETEVVNSPISLYESSGLYRCNDDAWALHPRFASISPKSDFNCYPPYSYQKFPEHIPFCKRCCGLQNSCGTSPTMDFNIRPNFPDTCFIPNKLPVSQLRFAMANVEGGADEIISKSTFIKPLEEKRRALENGPNIAGKERAKTIEEDFCATFECYSNVASQIRRKISELLDACEAEAPPNYSAWKEIELKMLSQYMNEYKEMSLDLRYAYTSALQINDVENLRKNCPNSAQLPFSWTEKALCSICATADDWDDNPIMFCDCCYLPMHVKCTALNANKADDETWVCNFCSYLLRQIPHLDAEKAFDVVRKLGTANVRFEQTAEAEKSDRFARFEKRNSLIPSFAFPENTPFIPISDVVHEKFVKNASCLVDNINTGWLFIRDPRVYVKMFTPQYEETALLVPFCMLCGFNAFCPAGGPLLPTDKEPLWAHIKCALTIGISPRCRGEEVKHKGGNNLYTGRCFECKRWGSCMVQCSNAECVKFFHVPCVTASRDCLYEWDTFANKPEILCQEHAKGISPTLLLRKVQQKLESDCYKNRVPVRSGGCEPWKLGIYAKDLLGAGKPELLELFRDAYLGFKGLGRTGNGDQERGPNGQGGTRGGPLVICFNQSGLAPQIKAGGGDGSDSPLLHQLKPQPLATKTDEPSALTAGGQVDHAAGKPEAVYEGTLKRERFEMGQPPAFESGDEEIDVEIPLKVLPTSAMLVDIFTDLPSFQAIRYASGISEDGSVAFFRSLCESAVALAELFDLGCDLRFILNLFNYISRVSFKAVSEVCVPEVAKRINLKSLDNFCSGCGIVESKRTIIKRCGVCLASICKSCFTFGVGAARSTANCTNSQFESDIVTCARCYKFLCGQPFGSCHLCGRMDGFLFAGTDCLVHLICAQLLIPPKSWGDGLKLGKIKNTHTTPCYYCRLNIGLTSTCASPTCGIRFHPYCAFVLKKYFNTASFSGTASSGANGGTSNSRDAKSKSENILKVKKPGIAFARIFCVIHSDRGDKISSVDSISSLKRAVVYDFFRGIDYTFKHRHLRESAGTASPSNNFIDSSSALKKGKSGKMDPDKKKGVKKTDLRKFLTMQEIMQYGHSGRTSDDSYYCPICFSLYYETTQGLPGDDLHWIGCDGCERWFHWVCIGYSDNDPPRDADWFCVTCKNPKGDQV